jgi:homocitrate synthase NifV
VTLREGLDVPSISLTPAERLRIATALAAAGVGEAEVVAPSRVSEDLAVARLLRAKGIRLELSGLVYGNRDDWQTEIRVAADGLDRIDVLLPLSARRSPYSPGAKLARLGEVLEWCKAMGIEVGVGFPHAMQVEPGFLQRMARRAASAGASRVTLYDTNGAADPFLVRDRVRRLAAFSDAPLFFHAHNDLGLATANGWAAVEGGAAGLDVTVNGLGDRAGNASLEQLAALLEVRGYGTGVRLDVLKSVSRTVARCSGIPVPQLAPVVGEFAFVHKSPGHFETALSEFEAFAPRLLGERRKVVRPGPTGSTTAVTAKKRMSR